MNFEEVLKLGINNLSKRKLRSWLTMLGIFIGIAAIVSILSVGQGLKSSVEEQFEILGTDKIIIQPSGTFGAPGADISTAELTKDDLNEVRSTLGVNDAAGMIVKSIKVEYNDQVRYHLASSIPDEGYELYKEFAYFEIEQGRDIKKGDKRKVVLGSRFAYNNLFKPNIKIRDKIKINDEDFKVVGIYESIGSSEDDSSVFFSEEIMRELFDVGEKYDMIVAQSVQDPHIVSERIEKNLRNFRNVEEGKEDFSVSTAEDFLSTITDVLDILNVFLLGIASISLIVGGIGIMNTMYTSVLERTSEIGVMKAIGARNIDIGMLFLVESGLLGLAGGAIGVLLGMGIGELVEYAIALTGNSVIKASFPPLLIVGALGFSSIVGAISGVMPAYRASKLKPTEALRYE